MTDTSQPAPPPGGQFLVYQTEDGKLKLDVRFEGETVRIQNALSEGELREDPVVKESLTTAADGKNYATKAFAGAL